MYGDRAKNVGPPPGSSATESQERALVRLWDLAKVFVDEKEKRGVPRAPEFGWETGEVVEKAARLTLRQVLPGLPSPDHGGLVDIQEVLPEELADVLNDPVRLMKEDPADRRPKPRVLCDDDEWPKIVQAMYERNLVTAVEHPVRFDGAVAENGAFGVVKPGKELDTGESALRLIMDLRMTNWMMEQIEAETHTLSGAAIFQRLIMEENQQVLVSGEDLTAAFYLFRLPTIWSRFMTLGKPVDRSILGLSGAGKVHAGLVVLPMGWHSSVGLMQAAHRRIALGSPLRGGASLSDLAEITKHSVFPEVEDGALWSIYLDDATLLEKMEEKKSADMAGKPPQEQKRLRDAYAWWGIPTNKGKTLEREREAERLGALLDGKQGILRTKTSRSLGLIFLGTWIRPNLGRQRKPFRCMPEKPSTSSSSGDACCQLWR